MMIDRITKVLPMIVMTINKQKRTISTSFGHDGQLSASLTVFCSVVFIFNQKSFKSSLWDGNGIAIDKTAT